MPGELRNLYSIKKKKKKERKKKKEEDVSKIRHSKLSQAILSQYKTLSGNKYCTIFSVKRCD